MAIKFEKIQPNAVLWDRHKTMAGNTTLRRMGQWPVCVKEVDAIGRKALVSWNGNKAEWWPAHRLEKLFAKKKESES